MGLNSKLWVNAALWSQANRTYLHKLLTINNYVNCPSNFAFARLFRLPILDYIFLRLLSIVYSARFFVEQKFYESDSENINFHKIRFVCGSWSVHTHGKQIGEHNFHVYTSQIHENHENYVLQKKFLPFRGTRLRINWSKAKIGFWSGIATWPLIGLETM